MLPLWTSPIRDGDHDMSPLEQVVPVRSLGLWEATCAVLARTTQGGGNVVAVVQGEGPMTEAVVKQAMQIMFDRHQTLRCRFTESGSVPRLLTMCSSKTCLCWCSMPRLRMS